jgi:hypothetical protein
VSYYHWLGHDAEPFHGERIEADGWITLWPEL